MSTLLCHQLSARGEESLRRISLFRRGRKAKTIIALLRVISMTGVSDEEFLECAFIAAGKQDKPDTANTSAGK